MLVNSFNASKVFAWPPSELTTHWWTQVFANTGVREAVLTSVEVGVVATLIALVLGTLLAFALARYTLLRPADPLAARRPARSPCPAS